MYDTYNLLYNNVTYRAFRQVLEESVDTASPSASTFVIELMNLLTDACLGRCGSPCHLDSEARLMLALQPLVSNLSGLAQRHLDNFGPSSASLSWQVDVKPVGNAIHIAIHPHDATGYRLITDQLVVHSWQVSASPYVGFVLCARQPNLAVAAQANEALVIAYNALRDYRQPEAGGKFPSATSGAKVPALSKLLHTTRAELHGWHHDVARVPTSPASVAAAWLQAAALLTGAAGDLMTEIEYPLTANRHAARAKLTAAFKALQQGIDATREDAYPLPDDLDEVVKALLDSLGRPPAWRQPTTPTDET